MSIKDFKISTIDSSKGLSLGEYANSKNVNSKAYGACGASFECSGGGGRCGAAFECSGGGGRCGASYSCSGS